MATYYVDPAGSNGNAGTSPGVAWATLAYAHTNTVNDTQTTILLKRGAIHYVPDTVQPTHRGLDNTRRFVYGAYGDGERPIVRPDPAWVTPRSYMWAIYTNTRFTTFQDIIFDADLNPNVGSPFAFAAANTINTGDIIVRRCSFRNSYQNPGLNMVLYGGGAQAAYYYYSILIEDCDATNNGAHGFYLSGRGTQVRNCLADGNGKRGTSGGHGFSTQGGGRTSITGTTGWTLVSGTTYYRDVAADGVDVFGVFSHDLVSGGSSTYPALVRTAGTVTTPAAGEYGVDTSTTPDRLYVNFNAAIGGGTTIIYIQGNDSITIADCVARNTVANNESAYFEGTGFQFDDCAINSKILRCISYNNDGSGFRSNNTQSNSFISCVSLNNACTGFWVNESRDVSCVGVTSYKDGSGSPIGRSLVRALPGGSIFAFTGVMSINNRGFVLRNYAINSGGRPSSIRMNSSAMDATLSTVEYGACEEFATAVQDTSSVAYLGGVGYSISGTAQNVGTPLLTSAGHLGAGSAAIHAGLFDGYRRAANGQFYNPPSIGAYEYVTARTARV